MFSVLIWIIFGFTFLFHLFPFGILYLTRGLIPYLSDKVTKFMKNNKIAYTTGYVKGKYTNKLLRDVVIFELFLIIFFSFIPLIFISISYSVHLNLIYFGQNINATAEKIIFGLTGFSILLYWFLMSFLVKKNKTIRVIDFNNLKSRFSKKELEDLYEKINVMPDYYGVQNIYLKQIVKWDKKILKKLKSKNTLSDKYNLYIF
ncbi:hypothetical protein CJJ23_01655 [Mycoplasmopsis agassizii]|uniref:Uncharacterized protein n=2 Tax=Mycoplasmopsis agassizii TaxID=33922 RepID=A0A269TJ40_9BACT|nr:hypothetical protein CJJ23_01655 [Mycoplasmopsis agassizii]